MTATERYNWAKSTPSDINELVPIMYDYAYGFPRITEFGVRNGVSTAAWQACKPVRLICYDIMVPPCLETLETIAKDTNCDFQFNQTDTSKVEIDQTEILFVDTLHRYDHVMAEIASNHQKVKVAMMFHDTEIYGVMGDDGGLGIMGCLTDFILLFPEWFIAKHYTQNNGLTILERKVL